MHWTYRAAKTSHSSDAVAALTAACSAGKAKRRACHHNTVAVGLNWAHCTRPARLIESVSTAVAATRRGEARRAHMLRSRLASELNGSMAGASTWPAHWWQSGHAGAGRGWNEWKGEPAACGCRARRCWRHCDQTRKIHLQYWRTRHVLISATAKETRMLLNWQCAIFHRRTEQYQQLTTGQYGLLIRKV